MFDLSINLIESLMISFFYTSSITLKDNVSFKKTEAQQIILNQ